MGETNDVTISVDEPVDVILEENPPKIDENELTPKAKRVLPLNPSTPGNAETPRSGVTTSRRDYRVLYEDLKRKTLEYQREMDARLVKHHSNFDDLSKKYEAEMESFKQDYIEREAVLTADNQLLKEKMEQMKMEHQAEMEKVKIEFNIMESKTQKQKPFVMRMNNEDAFVSKQKKGASGPTKGCGVSGCDKIDVDLIKCSLCKTLVCEECSSTKITKLRPIMNQCKTLYFCCPGCNVQISDKTTVNPYDVLNEKVQVLEEDLQNCDVTKENLEQQVKRLEEQQASLNLILEERETSLHETEAKLVSMEQTSPVVSKEPSSCALEELINKRFDTFDKRMDEMIERKIAGVLQIPVTTALSSSGETPKSFSAVVGGTTNRISELKTSRNAELIEKQEQERRMNNIIIHGINEQTGANSTDDDGNFIKSFLEAIEVNIQPKQIMRLGNKTLDKKRPLKVVLKNLEDKEKIMSSLTKLKNAGDNIRGISVRDDYTQEERKLIQTMHEEAKRRNVEESVAHWKVRGTPKNGLRVVKITTRN